MTLIGITSNGIDPALRLLPAPMDSPEARVAMLAIGLQESRFVHRVQLLNNGKRGPAHGFWQFEKGGVRGVVRHNASRYWFSRLCEARGCEFEVVPIWGQIETDDVLAAGLARLLLFTDPFKLPKLGDAKGAWEMYAKRLWRPGKPHPDTWPENYAAALAFVTTNQP